MFFLLLIWLSTSIGLNFPHVLFLTFLLHMWLCGNTHTSGTDIHLSFLYFINLFMQYFALLILTLVSLAVSILHCELCNILARSFFSFFAESFFSCNKCGVQQRGLSFNSSRFILSRIFLIYIFKKSSSFLPGSVNSDSEYTQRSDPGF